MAHKSHQEIVSELMERYPIVDPKEAPKLQTKTATPVNRLDEAKTQPLNQLTHIQLNAVVRLAQELKQMAQEIKERADVDRNELERLRKENRKLLIAKTRLEISTEN